MRELDRSRRWAKKCTKNEIDREVEKFSGLHLGGNGYTGVGVPDVIARSEKIAAEVVTAAAQFAVSGSMSGS
jgi:hypothetical protein